jgi:outer membrane protein insertion porin family
MLVKALKEIGVGETKIFDKASVDRAEQELKRQYLSHGLYGVKITTTVTPIERNRVNVMFNVDEGDVAKIKGINIVGNKAFSDKELRELLQLNTSGWFTWYSKADQYSKQKLTGDLEVIKSWYLNRGYLEANVESTQVAITPDKKDIYLTINITEGEKYTVSGVKLEGETFGREEELKQLILLRAGPDLFGRAAGSLEQAHLRPPGQLRLRLRQRQRQPGNQPREARSRLHLLRRSGQARLRAPHDISGNTITRDEVIRREFRQFESSWYDPTTASSCRATASTASATSRT